MIYRYVRQLASESLVYGLASVASRFLSVFLLPLYTRLFAPEDYGVLGLVTTAMAVVSIVTVLALDNSAHRWYWDTEDTGQRKTVLASWAWCQIAASLLFMSIILIFSDRLGWSIAGRGDAGAYFRLSALALPFTVLGGVLTNWLRMRRRPWPTAAFAVGSSLLNILLSIAFVAVLHWGLAGVFAAQLATAVIGTVTAAMLLGDWLEPRHFRAQVLREMLQYALPLIPPAIALSVVSLASRYLVQYYDNTSEVGLYQVANSVAAAVALGTVAFQQAWGPFAMSIHKQADARAVYSKTLLVYTWLTCLLGTGLSLLAPEIISLVATAQYRGASTAVSFLAFSYVFTGLGYIAALGPSLAKSTRPVGLAITAAAGMNIALSFVLVPRMGKEGAAIATMLSQAAVPVYLFYRSQQLYHVPYRFVSVLVIVGLSWALIAVGGTWHAGSPWIAAGGKLLLLGAFVPLAFLCGVVTLDRAMEALARYLRGGAIDVR